MRVFGFFLQSISFRAISLIILAGKGKNNTLKCNRMKSRPCRRISTLILRKISRIGARPAGTEETQFVGADLPQVVELVRIISFLPSGVTGLACGLVVLIVYLGW